MIKNIIISFGISLAVIASYHFYANKQNKVAYVDTVKLFAEFKLSKELLKEIEDVKKSRKLVLDTLLEKLRIESLKIENKTASDIEMKNFPLLREEYLYKQQQFEEENRKMTFEADSKVWNQLNQYVKEFGEKNSCKYILGATGQGNLMFAKESENVTEDLITFVNNEYEGKNK